MVHKERHFFLEKNNRSFFCVEYIPPEDKCLDISIILCKPIWGERIRTHMVFTNLARFLRQNGYLVITCDYFGDGNSGGETHELDFPAMVDSINQVHDYLSQNFNAKKNVLIGLRLGANTAMRVEPNLNNIIKMLLFDPIERPIDYFKTALRANLANQMIVHKKIIKTRDDLINDLKQNISVNIDGFVIGSAFWDSFENASPFAVETKFENPVVIYSITPPGRKTKKYDYSWITSKYTCCEIKSLEQEFIWTGWKKYVPLPTVFMNTVLEELNSIK